MRRFGAGLKINLMLLFIFCICKGFAYSYNYSGAVDYSNEWCNDGQDAKGYNTWNNPNGHAADFWYTSYSSDCANFVSQCLLAGGDFRQTFQSVTYAAKGPEFSPGQYTNTNQGGGGLQTTLIQVEGLRRYLLDRYHALYIHGQCTDIMGPGDVYLITGHAMFIANGQGASAEYNGHTTDRHHAPIGGQFNSDRAFFHIEPTVPYVKKVEVKQGTLTIYSATWHEVPMFVERTLLPERQELRNPYIANGKENLQIVVEFNESINGDPVIRVGSYPVQGGSYNNTRTAWTCFLPVSAMAGGTLDGEQIISISAQNYANSFNQLDANPATVAQWAPTENRFVFYGSQSGVMDSNVSTGGTDTNHKLKIQEKIDQAQQDVMHRRTTDKVIILGLEKRFIPEDIPRMCFNPLYSLPDEWLFDLVTYKPVVYCTPLQPYQGVGPYPVKAYIQDLDGPPIKNGTLNPDNIRTVFYTTDNGQTWQAVNMDYIDQPDLYNDEYDYQGYIPDLPDGAVVKYYVEAQDKADGTGNRITDPASTTATARPTEFYEFTVDKSPPQIALSANPNPFSPNGDAVQDRTLITYEVNDLSNFVTQFDMQLFNQANQLLISWPRQDFFPCPGQESLIWDGQGLAEGEYKLRATAIDRAYNSGAAEYAIKIDKTPPAITSPIISILPGSHPGVFTSLDSQINLSYQLRENLCNSVSVKIQINCGETLIVREQEWSITPGAGKQCLLSWDGKNENGLYVEDGVYSGSIIATDSAGNASQEIPVPSFVINRMPAKVTGLLVDNALFTPDDGPLGQGDGNKDTVTLTYQLSEPAQATIEIRNVLGQVVQSVLQPGSNQDGTYIWGGKVNNTYVSDGLYTFIVKTADEYGNTSFRSVQAIKNQVPAKISFPVMGASVGNTVVVTGIALDPGINDPSDFDNYILWVRPGENIDFGLPENSPDNPSTSIWQVIPVPVYCQNPQSPEYPLSNASVRTVMNSVLGDWDTQALSPGKYTLLLAVRDKSGHMSYDYCTVTLDPASDDTTPSINITNPPQTNPAYQYTINSETDILDTVYALTQTSGHQADVSLDVVQMLSGNSWGPVAYHQDAMAQAGNGSFNWVGKNQMQSAYMPDGSYKILVHARDADRMGVSTSEVDIMLARNLGVPIKITRLEADPPSAAIGTEVRIYYSISKPGHVIIKLSDGSGSPATTLIDADRQANYDYQLIWTPLAEGLYSFLMEAVSSDDNTSDKASLVMPVQSGTGSGTAQITSPAEGEILQGKTIYNWSATAKGDYYPIQDFTCNVSVHGRELYYPPQPIGFNWKMKCKGIESKTLSGTTAGQEAGTCDFNDTKFVIVNMPDHRYANGTYFSRERKWIYGYINYGTTFDNVPWPNVSWPWPVCNNDGVPVLGCDLEIVSVGQSGCVVRLKVLFDVYNIAGDKVEIKDGWLYHPWEYVFSWTVTGQYNLSTETSGYSSAQAGTPIGIPFSVGLTPTHGGTVSQHQLIMPDASNPFYPGTGSNDFDDNMNISTTLTNYSLNGNTFSGSLRAENTLAPLERDWDANFTLNSTIASQWATTSPYCYNNHPLESKSLQGFYTVPQRHVAYRTPKYTYAAPSNSNVAIQINSEVLKATTSLKDSTWTTSQDLGLSGQQGKIVKTSNSFNDNLDYSWFITENTPTAYSSAYPDVDMAAATAIKNKYTFWKQAGQAVGDNPYVGIDADAANKGWEVGLDYPDGMEADDFAVNKRLNTAANQDHEALGNPIDINDNFSVQLAKGAGPRRFAVVRGQTSTLAQGFKSYMLFYHKNTESIWHSIGAVITTPVESNGVLGYWNTTNFQGEYTLRLLVWDNTGIAETLRNVNIGKQAIANQNNAVTSPCNKAYLTIPQNSLAADTVINISPVKAAETSIVLDPNLPQPLGPVYKLEPEGLTFDPQNPAWLSVRLLPSELAGIDPGLLSVYYLKSDGTIESLDIPAPTQELTDDATPIQITRIDCPIQHFSYYMVITGIAPPVINQLPAVTNMNPLTVQGTAEPKSWVEIFVNAALAAKVKANDSGAFSLAVALTEGNNQITARATRLFANGSQTSKLSQPITVVLDTQAPMIDSLVVSPNPFSPNGDGMNDSTQISFVILEPAAVDLQVLTGSGAIVRSLLHNQSLGAGGHTQIWDGKNTQGQYVTPGEYFVEVIARDAAGNEGKYRQRVVALDDTEAPSTTLTVGQPHYIDATGNTLLAAATRLTLQAADSGSGISELRYRINGGFWQDKYTSAYSFSLPAEDGIYQLDYLSFDKQDNADILHSQLLLLDNTGPDASLKVNAPSATRDGATYVSGNTLLEVLSADPIINQVSSGVKNTYYQINGQAFSQGSSFFLGQMTDGEYNIGRYAVDNVGNTGQVNAVALHLDNTPPVSQLNHSEAYFIWNGGLYVSPDCLFTLTAADSYSGVSATAMQLNQGTWKFNPAPFKLPEGDHVLNFYAIDNVGNIEDAQTITIHVPLPDTTPPITTLTIGNPKYAIPGTVETLVTTYTAFSLSAVDILGANDGVALGVDYTQYAINTTGLAPSVSEWQEYNAPVYINDSGRQYFWYRSADLGGNTEVARKAIVLVKTAKPEAELLIPSPGNTGVCQVMNGMVKIYGTAQDPYFAKYTLSLVSGSSQRQIKFSDSAVTGNMLAVLNTRLYESGEYQLVLQVTDRLGQMSEAEATVVLHEPALKQIIDYSQGCDGDRHECEGRTIRPQYLAQDTDGNIYVTDFKHCAYKLDPSGMQVFARYPKDRKGGHEQGRLILPQGIVVDGQGFVYIVDQAKNCVYKYANSGEHIKTWPGKGSAKKLNSPQGMTLGTDGLLYIADKLNGRVVVIDKEFNFVKEVRFIGQVTAACNHPSSKFRPTDTAVFGNVLYVTDEHAGKVYKFRLTDNACVGIIGKEGVRRNEFKQPQGICTNSLGYWYVSDTGNGRIVKYNAKDEIVAVWAIQEIQRGKYLSGTGLGICSLANGELLAADVKLGNVKRYGLGDTLVPAPGTIAACILSPATGSLVNGNVHIVGTAQTADYKHFSGFELTYIQAGGQEKTIARQKIAKERELLAVWDATRLPAGNYELKLTVKNKAGQQKSSKSFVTVGDWSFLGQIGTGEKGKQNSRFDTPWDAEIDAYSQLYVADSGNNRLQKFNPDDQYLATLGNSGNRPGEFKRPTNIAVDSQGRLYVVDSGNCRVQVLDLNGNYIKEYRTGLKWPASVACDEKGVVHILDSDGRIYYMDNQENLKATASWPSEVLAACHAPMEKYSDLAATWSDAFGNTLTKYFDRANQMSQRVEKLDAYGREVFAYKGACGQYLPQNIAAGPLGNIWITDSSNHRVQEFGPFGNLLGSFGGFGAIAGKFDSPHGLAFKQADDQVMAYVVDTGNQRVQKFTFAALGQPTPIPSMTPTANLEIAGLRAQPESFVPEDGQATQISYLVTQPANVKLLILDQFGGMVRDLGVQASPRAGELAFRTWDGRNNFGQMVQPQQYIIRAEAFGNGQQYSATTFVIVLARGQEPPTPVPTQQTPATPVSTPTPIPTNTPEPTRTPTPTKTWTPTPEPTATPEPEVVISNYYAIPNPFRPQNGQVANIHYTLSVNANTSVVIKNKCGQTVYSFGPFTPGTPGGRQGENILTWNGQEQDDGKVHAACHWQQYEYTCIISAQAGSKSDQKQFIIVKELYH